MKKFSKMFESIITPHYIEGKFPIDIDLIFDCFQELLDSGYKIASVSGVPMGQRVDAQHRPTGEWVQIKSGIGSDVFKRVEQSNRKELIGRYYSRFNINKTDRSLEDSTINLHVSDNKGNSTSPHFVEWNVEKNRQLWDRLEEIKDRLEDEGYHCFFCQNGKNNFDIIIIK